MANVFQKEMGEHQSPPGRFESPPEPFLWKLVDGAEMWTDKLSLIERMSDSPIIDGLLRDAEVASIVGGAKSYKTWLALGLALAVAMGSDFLGFKTHRRRVLYLDYELKEGTFRKRLCMLAESKPEGFLYQLLRGESRLPSVEDIRKIVEAEQIGLVVVDSIYRTGWLSEENSNDSTAKELTPLQQLASATDVSILCIDHTAKGGGHGRTAVDASRGASAKGGFFDGILVLRPTAAGPDPEGNYVVLDPVVRDWPGLQDLPLLSFTWSETSASIDLAGEVDSRATNDDSTVILSLLADLGRPVGVAELVDEKRLSGRRIRKGLKSLVAKGKVKTSEDPNHSQRILYSLADPVG